MTENTYAMTLGGRTFEFKHVAMIVPAATLILRLAMGWIFIWSGFDKLITNFSATGFLVNGTSGPLKDTFVRMGESQTAINVIDPLVIWGQILIGFSLVLGIFTRFGLLMASLMVFMFYLAQLWPANNPFLDDHIIYMAVFALLGALGAGRILGLDAVIEKIDLVKRIPPLQYVLG
jgi:thiosulfate dehydrogenase [quinone] large subunit